MMHGGGHGGGRAARRSGSTRGRGATTPTPSTNGTARSSAGGAVVRARRPGALRRPRARARPAIAQQPAGGHERRRRRAGARSWPCSGRGQVGEARRRPGRRRPPTTQRSHTGARPRWRQHDPAERGQARSGRGRGRGRRRGSPTQRRPSASLARRLEQSDPADARRPRCVRVQAVEDALPAALGAQAQVEEQRAAEHRDVEGEPADVEDAHLGRTRRRRTSGHRRSARVGEGPDRLSAGEERPHRARAAAGVRRGERRRRSRRRASAHGLAPLAQRDPRRSDAGTSEADRDDDGDDGRQRRRPR